MRTHGDVQILETSVAAVKAGGGHKMSLWVDVEMGRPIEVEVSSQESMDVQQQSTY